MIAIITPILALLISVSLLLMGNGLQSTLLPVRAGIENFSAIDTGILTSRSLVCCCRAYETSSTASPRTSKSGSIPSPGLSEAVIRPFTRCGAPCAMVTVP